MKSAEQQLAEALEKIATLAKENEAFKAQSLKLQQESAASELGKLMAEAKLPEVAQNRLKSQFKDAAKTDNMKEAVQAEADYIKSLGGTRKNNGVSDNGQPSGEANEAASKAKLVESFMKNFQCSKEQAELMAE